jgi:hypothetical protein
MGVGHYGGFCLGTTMTLGNLQLTGLPLKILSSLLADPRIGL